MVTADGRSLSAASLLDLARAAARRFSRYPAVLYLGTNHLAYPVALVMSRSAPLVRRIITMIVIAPLIVSVVVRTYGWELILGNGPTGILNWLLLATGIAKTPVRLLYTETAVVIGSLHVFFPMMVLPLASALGKIDPRLEDAARTLGAGVWRAFCRITLPLSLPGLAVGCALVFSLTAGSRRRSKSSWRSTRAPG